ncbi:MAG: 7-cyano-7-deazaguanine synthase QueC [Planctomycetota bacterium]|nr:7-cyano-7-deazaguanine synthase QueC [Planctomycetota bacterium]
MPGESKQAVVLLSGGLDSATTLAIAQDQGFECFAMSFAYGQKCHLELDAAKHVARALGAIDHVIVSIDLRAFGGSALTDDIDVPKDRPIPQLHDSDMTIPITYVPARNTIFLSYALGFAEARGITDIYIGVNALDYSGYPDCRPQYIASFEAMANLATKIGVEGRHIRIHTPLIDLTKAQIINLGIGLGVDYGLTVSCYDPNPKTGVPCWHCDSCQLRAAGFSELGIPDPSKIS